jgi:hypothetical protein
MKPNCLYANRVCDQATLRHIDLKIRDISKSCYHPAGIYMLIRKHIRTHYHVSDLSELPPKPRVIRQF